METTNDLVTTPATAGSSSCHGGGRASGGWLRDRGVLIFGGGAILVAVALAFGQHWLSTAALTLLLFLLPCAVMMFMSMKGMNHSRPVKLRRQSTRTSLLVRAPPSGEDCHLRKLAHSR